MLTLAQELNHVIKTPVVIDRVDGVPVYAPLDIPVPGYEFKVSELADVADDLYYLAKEKKWFQRPTFAVLENNPGKTDREKWDYLLLRSRTQRRPPKQLVGPENVAVWEEWVDGVKILNLILFRDPNDRQTIWFGGTLGKNLYVNNRSRRRAYWDIGIRKMRTTLPADHYLTPKHLSTDPIHKFEVMDEWVIDGQRIVQVEAVMTERP